MIVELLETELGRYHDHTTTAQWAIELLVSRRFKRYLQITKDDLSRIDRAAVGESAKYDGKGVIETNDDTTSLEDAACGYKGLMVIELLPFPQSRKDQTGTDVTLGIQAD